MTAIQKIGIRLAIFLLPVNADCADYYFSLVNLASSTNEISTDGLYFLLPKETQKIIDKNKIEKAEFPTLSVGHYLIIKSGDNYRVFKAHELGGGRLFLINCKFGIDNGKLTNITQESLNEGIIISKVDWNFIVVP